MISLPFTSQTTAPQEPGASQAAAAQTLRARAHQRLTGKKAPGHRLRGSRAHRFNKRKHANTSFDLNPPETPARRRFHRALYATLIPVLNLVVKAVYGAKVVRASRDPLPRGVVVVINHVCYLDSVMSAVALWPARLRFLSLASNGYGHIWGPIVRALGTIFVGNTLAQTREMLERQSEALAAGDYVAIFPEGNLVPYEDRLQKFQKGAFQVAATHRAPVVPVTLVQAPKRGLKRLLKKPGFEIHVGRPIFCKAGMSRHECAAYLEQKARMVMEAELARGPVYGAERPLSTAVPEVQQSLQASGEQEATERLFAA